MRIICGLLSVFFAISAGASELNEKLALAVRAEGGEVAAQIELADGNANGRWGLKDPKAALEWYGKAAGQGSGEARMALGRLYLGGAGVPKNSTEAAKWFLLAAEQGMPAAQCQMARMHLAGAGVAKDDVEAYKWAKVAAAQGDRQAKRILEFLNPRMTAVQRAKADKLALEIMTKKAPDSATEGIPLVAPPLE